VEGSDCGLVKVFPWRNWGVHKKPVSTVGILAMIWTGHFQNISQKHCHLRQLFLVIYAYCAMPPPPPPPPNETLKGSTCAQVQFHTKGHTPDLGKKHTRNTTWMPYIKIAWGKCERTFLNTAACGNSVVILMCELVQFSDFLQLIVAWWWPHEAETCSNEWHFMNFKCNYKWHLQ
jgi:hypothetical protein